jgi:catechol 2,3-dioxygenase-like lactoylglutathione lyase family enzyme
MIERLHHSAYRCRDSEETRRFYEDLLGLPLAIAIELRATKTGRSTRALHTFYALGDGSFLAFFEVPDEPFEFKEQRDYDLHVALETHPDALEGMLERARREGVAVRGVTDHGFLRSIYLRDPSGYVIELTARMPGHERAVDPLVNGARARLDAWQAAKAGGPDRQSAPASTRLKGERV